MKEIQCTALWTGQDWMAPAYVTLDNQGIISRVAKETGASRLKMSQEQIDGLVVPGFLNGHSHAFQYAMAGLAEHLPTGTAQDDFWSWREAMYGLANQVSADDIEAIATMLYAELLRFGVTGVAEFHYLHLSESGSPYADPTELSQRLMIAADRAGIQLTLIPVFYRQGGFGKEATERQRRFLSRSVDEYWQLIERAQVAAKSFRDVQVGIGIHSLRAAATSDLLQIFAKATTGPIHLHIAEQKSEVEACLKHLGNRPVAWLLDHVGVDRRFNLVHATHLTAEEVTRLAKSGSTVVLCPSTEGNLGDGLFPLRTYVEQGGKFAIGSDSHVSLSPTEELRWLDYGQRLAAESRATLCYRGGDDGGERLVREAWNGGRRALGLHDAQPFQIGLPFDAVVIDHLHPPFTGRPAQRWLSSLVYASDSTVLKGTLRRGEWIVRDGRHRHLEPVRRAYATSVKKLLANL